jgi:adenylate kinase family enzyme
LRDFLIDLQATVMRGDMKVDDIVAGGTTFKSFRQCMQERGVLPADAVTELLMDKLQHWNVNDVVLVDGLPRTLESAKLAEDWVSLVLDAVCCALTDDIFTGRKAIEDS